MPLNNTHFYDWELKSYLKDRIKLKKYISLIFISEKKSINNIDIVFTNDKNLLFLNRKFLKHNYYTDVLTFLLPDNKTRTFGEIYISIERIRENADLFLVPYQSELVRIIIHGCLHLCGYEDTDELSRKRMIKTQEIYLKKWVCFT